MRDGMCLLAASALWSTLLGGLLAICGGIVGTWWAKTLEYYGVRRQIASALAGEIMGILEVVRRRELLENFERSIQESEEGGILIYKVFPVSESFIAVFEGNIAQIGMLPHPVAADVAYLYASIKSIWEDLKTLQREPVNAWDFDEGIAFLSNLVDLIRQTKGIAWDTARKLNLIAQRRTWRYLFNPNWEPTLEDDHSAPYN